MCIENPPYKRGSVSVLNPQFIRGACAWCERHPVILLDGPEPDTDIPAAQPGPGGLDGKSPSISRTGIDLQNEKCFIFMVIQDLHSVRFTEVLVYHL